MVDKRFCKVIEDLLPNYIEKMTTEETDKFIEEHIQNCQECRYKLDNMKSNIELEKVDEREIEYLKAVKKKNNFKILIVISISIIIIILLLYVSFNYRFIKTEDGFYKIERATIEYNKISNYNILILRGKQQDKNSIDNTLYITWYAIYETETQKCTNIIQEIKGYNDEKLKEQYKNLKEDWNYLYSPRTENNKLYININNYNGKNKEDLKQIFNDKYEIIEFEEI